MEQKSQIKKNVNVAAAIAKNQTIGSRAVKYVSSRTLDTKLGRKFMIHSFGPDGSKLAQFLIQSGNNHFGDARCSEHLKMILKMISKTQSVIQQGGFDLEESNKVRDPIHDFLFEIYRILKNSDSFFSQDELKSTLVITQQDAETAANKARTAVTLWHNLMLPHLTQRNADSFKETCDVITVPEFLKAVLEQEELKQYETREQFLASLNTYVNTFQIDVGLMQVHCSVSTCGKPVLQAVGMFIGSRLCHKHHQEYTMKVFAHPKLKDFVDTNENRRYLKNYLESLTSDQGKKNSLFFKVLVANSDFRKTIVLQERKEAVKIFMEHLDAYQNAYPNSLDQEMCKKLLESMKKILEESQVPPMEHWKPLLSTAEGVFEAEIIQPFMKSSEFFRLILSNTLPPNVEIPTLDKITSSNAPLTF